jgi:hypothetical protein
MLQKFSFLLILCIFSQKVNAQEANPICKVLFSSIDQSYEGECKKGLAHGKGVAKGTQKYVGEFSKGYPNGIGEFYYSDSVSHIGSFQNGLREGKGEAHFLTSNKKDTTITGYWSGDIFKGQNYVTHETNGRQFFSFFEIRASKGYGDTVIFETSSTKYPFSIQNITADVSILNRNSYTTPNKTNLTITLSSFPARLQITMSYGLVYQITLYKPADWFVKMYNNS